LIPGAVGENVKLATTCDEVADTVTVVDAVEDCPMSLVTVSVTVYVAPCEYRCVGAAPEPVDPSPKFQAKVPLLGVEADALKKTS
jgi:hypothetical protein